MLATIAWSVVAFMVTIGLVVTIHEGAHFTVGRLVGAPIDVFSIGIGPELARWTDRRGVSWRLAAFPIGGYVKFSGDRDVASLAGSGLDALALWRRAAIIPAGPLSNIVLAVLLFATVFALEGRVVIPPVVSAVIAGGPAARAGLLAGDEILSLDGRPISDALSFIGDIESNGIGPRALVVERLGVGRRTLFVDPEFQTGRDPLLGVISRSHIGIEFHPDHLDRQSCSPLVCVWWSVAQTADIARSTGGYLHALVLGRQSSGSLAGPVSIAAVGGKIIQSTVPNFLDFLGKISLAIGLTNLLPIPLLDGGHLVFYAIEAISRRQPSVAFRKAASAVGLVLVLGLMGIALFNDVVHLVS